MLNMDLNKFVDHVMKAINENNLEKVVELFTNFRSSKSAAVSVNSLRLVKSGDTPLHVAARTSNASHILRYLIEEEHGNIELGNSDGKTPLHDAAHFNELESVKVLLEHGANVNALKRADWTPLMLACTKQDTLEVIKLLLEYNSDIFFINKDGWNCFHIACREGNVSIIKYLILYTTISDYTLEQKKRLLFSKSRNGRTAIHTTIMHGHYEICNILLHEAVNMKVQEVIDDPDKYGSSSMMEACRFGQMVIIDLLNSFPCTNLHATNLNGMNCLHIAAENGQINVIEHLISKFHFDVNLANQINGMTPLHYAVRENQSKAIYTLLKFGADVNQTDLKGWTSTDMSEHLKKTEAFNILNKFRSGETI